MSSQNQGNLGVKFEPQLYSVIQSYQNSYIHQNLKYKSFTEKNARRTNKQNNVR